MAGAPAGLKILMLHGFTQSGALFHAKTRAFEKALIKAFPASTLHYATGPIALDPADIPGFEPSNHTTADDRIESYAWWRRADGSNAYTGIERFFEAIAGTIAAHGPFDGVIGFSQGGCAAPIVASLLDPGRKAAFDAARSGDPAKIAYPDAFVKPDGTPIQEPLKFAIAYSGFMAPEEHYLGFYEPKIKTPVLHVIGSLDTLVSEERSRKLVAVCQGGDDRVVVHPGGHFMPTQRVWLDKAYAFIRSCTSSTPLDTEFKEERAEDMDVPF